MHQKTVLVTGASRGIGRAIALHFAKEGCHVFLNSHHSIEELKKVQAEIQETCHISAALVPGDVGNPDDVRQIFQTIESSVGGLDILVNNAGIAHIGLFTDMTDKEWNRLIQTNLSSVFYCCRQALPYMISKKDGCIINISSRWGTVGASCEVAYSAAKSGINGLTRALSKELAPSNIRVNALACGVIDTEMNSMLTPEDKKELAEEIPSGRFGTPEEVAKLAWQVANAPSYMTGQIIGIDGGFI